MSKAAEIEEMARLALSRQAETDMRVDVVDAKAGEAADAAASAGGRTPPPVVAAPSLDGLYGWRPKAFSVWFTTGGGGKVGVSFPEKCVSYNGNHMDDGVLTPSVQEDPETKFRWCELEAPSEKAPKLIFTLVRRGGEGDNAGEGGISAAYLEWVESVDDAKADHGASDETVLVCVPIAEYDAGLDRLVQVHVGALALGGDAGGGGGGGEAYGDERSVCRAADPSGMTTVNALQLCGFGKFTTKQSSAEYGSFTASDEYDIGDVIDRDMRAKTGDDGLALVVRSGNTNAADANTVGYKTLKYEPVHTPFQVVVDRGQDQAGHEIIAGRRVEAGVVYDGVREVAVAPLQNVPDTGTVYLTATRAAGEGRWGNFRLDTRPAAPGTGKALNIKLYDFAQGKVEMDYRTTFLTLPSGGVTPDDVSTEFIPEPEGGEEPAGDEGKLQIFDFNSNESDSPEGLAERLHADTKTGDITIQSGTNIMLLARRDGKMVYIPLTAGGTDPEDEKPYDPENPDPCAHPGDDAPGAETHGGGGGGGGVPVGGGGVPAGGDIHTGDDDCNCE